MGKKLTPETLKRIEETNAKGRHNLQACNDIHLLLDHIDALQAELDAAQHNLRVLASDPYTPEMKATDNYKRYGGIYEVLALQVRIFALKSLGRHLEASSLAADLHKYIRRDFQQTPPEWNDVIRRDEADEMEEQ